MRKEGKKVCTGHTIEIGVCAKPRLVPSGHLACHDVTNYMLLRFCLTLGSSSCQGLYS